MISFYFKLQFRRFERFIRKKGLPLVFAFFLIFFIFYYVSEFVFIFLKDNSIKFLYIFFSIIVYLFSLNRNKNNFLKCIISHRDLLKIKLIDSLRFAVLPVGFLLLRQHFLLAITCLILHILAVFIRFNFKTNFKVPTPFTKFPFEFIVGFRKNYWAVILFNALGVIAIVEDNPNIGVFALITLSLLYSFFFLKSEIPYFVWMFKDSPGEFLRKKSSMILYCFFIVQTPIFLALSIAYPARFWLFSLALLTGLLLITTSCFAKYAAFPTKINLDYMTILILSILAPPLVLIALPYFYGKSKDNLKTVLC